MKAIVTGMIATYPMGGVAWDYGQYALGFERLGFDVVYLEDTGWECFHPISGSYGTDWSYGTQFLDAVLRSMSPTLGQRWHVRTMDGSSHGISQDELDAALDDADLFVNVSGGTLLRPEYLRCRNKVLIDSDPGWNHFRNWPKWEPKPDWPVSSPFHEHDHFFTYAERIGRPGCRLPDFGLDWHPTRPPVLVDEWTAEPPGDTWTTVLTWKNFAEEIEHDGIVYGTKEIELERVERLPELVPYPMEMAVGAADDRPDDHWRKLGWSLIEAGEVSMTPIDYQSYVQGSRGEFSVAKNVYVATRSGWFSCRSACYLAAGRPVVVQDTGFGDAVPVGDGVLAFSDLDSAVAALEAVEADYEHHASAAVEIAASHFAADVVLGDLLERIGLG